MTDRPKSQELIDAAFNTGPDVDLFIPTPNRRGEPVRATFGAAGAIDNLRTELGRGGMPQVNRFQMNINPPTELAKGQGPDILRRIVVRTQAVDLPGNTLATSVDNNIYGPNRNVVQGVEYADSFDAKFLMDEKFELHNYFTSWQRLMYNDKTWNLSYYNDYASGTIDIFVLDRGFNPVAGFRVWECYPSTIGPISFDMGSNDPINDFTVSFNFRYWSDIGRYGTKQPTEMIGRGSESFQERITGQNLESRALTQFKRSAELEDAGD